MDCRVKPGNDVPVTAIINALANAVVAIALIGELVAVFANVISRSLFDTAFLWTDEVAKLSLSTLAFVGGAIAYAHGHHTFVRVGLNALGPRLRDALMVASDFTVLLVAAVTGYASIFLIEIRWNELTPILQMPAAWIVVPLCASMVLLMFYAGRRLLRARRAIVVAVGGIGAAMLALALATRPAWLPWFAGDGAITAALASFFVTIFGGLPVGFGLLLSTTVYLWLADTVPMVALPQNMVDGTGNFVLLALPFFILAGLIMERGGISLRLVRFVHALVGHLRGGLLHVMVLSMYLVSGLSGSKTADVAAVVAACLMALISMRARRGGGNVSRRASLRTVMTSAIGAILPLLMPVILFAGILFGVATPTEVSSFAVVYGLILSCLIYRELDLAAFLRTVLDSAMLAGMVLFILGAASGFSWALTVAYLPQRLVEVLHGINDNTVLFVIGSIALLIVV